MQKPFTRGFTLVELLIVIIVITILAGIVIMSYRGTTQRAVNAQITEDLERASDQLEIDFSNTQLYPASAAAVDSGKGFVVTNGTVLTYTPSADQKSYCLQGSSAKPGTKTYKVVQEGAVQEGAC